MIMRSEEEREWQEDTEVVWVRKGEGSPNIKTNH